MATIAPASAPNQAGQTSGFFKKAEDTILSLFNTTKTVYEGVTGRTLANKKIEASTVKPPKTIVSSFGDDKVKAAVIIGGIAVLGLILFTAIKK